MASAKPKKAVSAKPPHPAAAAASPRQDTTQIREERYRVLIEDVADGFYEVDLHGNFKFFNDALCRIFGHSRQALQDRETGLAARSGQRVEARRLLSFLRWFRPCAGGFQ